MWAGWASEIAGDAFAFAFTGFGAVSALHDVVDGDGPSVFLSCPGIRIRSRICACCWAWRCAGARSAAGGWDRLARAWTPRIPLAHRRPRDASR